MVVDSFKIKNPNRPEIAIDDAAKNNIVLPRSTCEKIYSSQIQGSKGNTKQTKYL